MARGPGRPKGSGKGIKLSEEYRGKIKCVAILNALTEHALGEREMSGTQVTAGLGLLKKALPDLQAVDLSGDISHEVKISGWGVR